MMRNFAFTYAQLMNQAIASGWPKTDLIRLKRAYECAEELLDGVYRGQRAPFVCHVTRTASILIAEKMPVGPVMGGLLHACYSLSYFEDGVRGKMTDAHRAEVTRRTDNEAETYAYEYEKFPWYRDNAVKRHFEKLTSYNEREKQLVVMRLANELEDYLDLGMAYRAKERYQKRIDLCGREMVELAVAAGHPVLAQELQEAFELHAASQLPPDLITNTHGSYLQPVRKKLEMDIFSRILQKTSARFKKKWVKEKISASA